MQTDATAVPETFRDAKHVMRRRPPRGRMTGASILVSYGFTVVNAGDHVLQFL